LLILNSLIAGEWNVEFGDHPYLEIAAEMPLQLSRQALVEQNSQALGSGAFDQQVGLAKSLDGLFPFQRRVFIENIVQAMSICKILEEHAHRYARAGEDRHSA
jgi:hypothetical protein